jgi:site-specific DNA recombinase
MKRIFSRNRILDQFVFVLGIIIFGQAILRQFRIDDCSSASPAKVVAVSCRRRRSSTEKEAGDPSNEFAASYSRFSTDLQREESNTDQQRKCRERAEENGHQIPSALEFNDEAVSGTKLRRVGLDAMIAAAEE